MLHSLLPVDDFWNEFWTFLLINALTRALELTDAEDTDAISDFIVLIVFYIDIYRP